MPMYMFLPHVHLAAGHRLYLGNLSCRYRRVHAVPCPVPGVTVQYTDMSSSDR